MEKSQEKGDLGGEGRGCEGKKKKTKKKWDEQRAKKRPELNTPALQFSIVVVQAFWNLLWPTRSLEARVPFATATPAPSYGKEAYGEALWDLSVTHIHLEDPVSF